MSENQTSARLAALEEQIRQLSHRLQMLEETAKPTHAPAVIIPEHPFTTPVPPLPVFQPLPEPKPEAIRAAAPVRPHFDMEATIGKNWASWIGAILLLLGVCFFLKYAWDHQWINPTPLMRMVTGIIIGIIVAFLGEWTFRRSMQSLAGACFGAGIAIIMASFFFGAAYFAPNQRPISMTGAFIAVAVTTLAGVVLAWRASNPTSAVIALLGAYLSPFILNTGADHSLDFLIYLTLVTALAWALDVLRWQWTAVRLTACIGAWAAYTLWENNIATRHQDLAIVFASIFFLSFLADFFATARFLIRRAAKEVSKEFQNSLAILSIINTAAAFDAFYQTLHKQSLPEVGIAALMLALFQAAITLLLDESPLKLSSRLQTAILITLAIPLLLDHFAITAAWSLMALLLCALGRILNHKWLYRWSIALWLLAVVRLLFFDANEHRLWITWFSLSDLQVSAWLLMAVGLSMLAHVIANLRPGIISAKDFDKTPLSHALAAAGTLLFLVTQFVHPSHNEWTFAALAWAALLLALQSILRIDYTWHILALLLAITMKWIFADSIVPVLDDWDRLHGMAMIPLLNHGAIAGALLIGLLVWCTMRFRSSFGSPVTVPGMAIWIGALLFIFASIESCRCADYFAGWPDAVIKQVTLSILWAAIGLASVFVGFSRKIVALRYAALILLGVTLIKILIIDMADVQAIWRILSFLGVGLLLLAVSYTYHKQFVAASAE